MIEDSLKSIRNIYRLLITVSFITLVFSLSISPPKDKKNQRDLINELIGFDFLEYELFVEGHVKKFSSSKLNALSTSLGKKLKNDELLIFNLHHIHEAFSQDTHLGKILVSDLVLTNIGNTSLNQLDALNGLSLDRDVQVLVPEIDGIAKEIVYFLKDNNRAGLRVDNVNLSIGDYTFTAESFLPEEDMYLSLYFELPANIRTGGSPVFNADFPAEVVSLPGTSFTKWLLEKTKEKNIVEQRGNKLVWLPSLENIPNGFREQKLGLLAKDLTDEINKSSPEEQKVSLFGTNIPGILFVYTSPLILLALMYYFMNHSFHLLSLTKNHMDEINRFAWSPLSLKKFWYVDLLGSSLFLPLISMSVLYFQLVQFRPLSVCPTIILLVCAVGVMVMAIVVFNKVKIIHTAKEHPEQNVNR